MQKNNMKDIVGIYEKEVVDQLWKYEKQGKGTVLELCSVDVSGKKLPFVAFSTGSDLVVTARHHINEFWGTTEAVMKLAESGEEGLTLIPVVDVAYYAESQEKKEGFLNAEDGWAAVLTYDMYRGYKGGPQTHAKNQWDYYKYNKDDSPGHIQAIKGLIDSSELYIDIHNSKYRQYFFLTVLPPEDPIPELFQNIAVTILDRGQIVSNQYSYGPNVRLSTYPGVYTFTGRETSINYAGAVGKLNLGMEIPVFDHRSCTPGTGYSLAKIEEIADVTAGAISALRKRIVF